MKSRFLYLVGFILLLMAAIPLFRTRPDSIPWHRNYDEALGSARESGKTMLVYLYTDWCSFCRKMDAETFADPGLIKSMKDRFVWLRLNAEKDSAGMRLQQEFAVRGYPTTLVLDSEGDALETIAGFVAPEDFPVRVEQAAASPASLASLKARARSEATDPESQFALATAYLERQQFEKAEKQFLRVIELDPSNLAGKTDASLYYVAEARLSLHRFPNALDSIESLRQRFPSSKFAVEAILMKAEVLVQTGRREEARLILNDFLGDHPEHSAGPRIRDFLEQDSL